MKELSFANYETSYIKRVENALEINETDCILEIACGRNGYIPRGLKKKCRMIIGTDFDFDGILNASKISEREIPYLVCTGDYLPFKNGTFTKLCAIAVLEHIHNDFLAVQEIARVVKTGGKVFITVPNSYFYMPGVLGIMNLIHDPRIGHLRHYYAPDLIRMFEQNGFKLDQLIYHGHKIKVLQFILSVIFKLEQKKNSKLWWYLEKKDDVLCNDPKSANFSIVLTKER